MGKIADFFGAMNDNEGHRVLGLGLALLYIIITGLVILESFLNKGFVYFGPDYLFFLFVTLVILIGKNRHRVIWDFAPLALLLFAYDSMRGYADDFASSVNYAFPIGLDSALMGGTQPVKILQTLIDGSGHGAFFSFISIFVYSLHFTVPMLFGFFIWMRNRAAYQQYAVIILLLSYAALITFWMFPVAPPWMANEEYGLGIEHKFKTLSSDYHMEFLFVIYYLVNANPVAAIPSLHFAYPFASFLFAMSKREKALSVLFGAYVILVGLSLVYLGEHYLTDLIFGAVYAAIAMVLAKPTMGVIQRMATGMGKIRKPTGRAV